MMALRRHITAILIISPAMSRSWWTGLTPRSQSACAPGTRLWRENPRVVLGSSLYSAQLAAQLGLPFALPHTSRRICCSRRCIFIAATQTVGTVGETVCDGVHQYYRRDSNRDAEFLFTSMQQAFVKRAAAKPGNCRHRFKIWISSGAVRTVWCAAGAEYVAGGR